MTCIRSNRLENRFSGLVQALHRASVNSLQRTNTLLSRLTKEQRGHADTNLHRRHLNETQRAVIAARLANMQRGEYHGNQYEVVSENLPIPNISQSAAADLLNVSDRMIRAVKSVERDAPDLVPLMETGRSSRRSWRIWSAAETLARTNTVSGKVQICTLATKIPACKKPPIYGSNQYQSKSANLRNSISQPEAADRIRSVNLPTFLRLANIPVGRNWNSNSANLPNNISQPEAANLLNACPRPGLPCSVSPLRPGRKPRLRDPRPGALVNSG